MTAVMLTNDSYMCHLMRQNQANGKYFLLLVCELWIIFFFLYFLFLFIIFRQNGKEKCLENRFDVRVWKRNMLHCDFRNKFEEMYIFYMYSCACTWLVMYIIILRYISLLLNVNSGDDDVSDGYNITRLTSTIDILFYYFNFCLLTIYIQLTNR